MVQKKGYYKYHSAENLTEHSFWLSAKKNILYNNIKKRSIHKKIYLRTVVLLDNDSTIDLFCNPELVEDIKR